MQKILWILGEFIDEDIDWLASIGQKEAVPAGHILIHEGKSVDTLYILLDGTLVVTVSALEGKQIARLASGEVVGEMSFIDERPPSATVQTMEQSTVLAIPRKLLAEKLQTDIAFSSRFFRALAVLLSRRLRDTVKQFGKETAQVSLHTGPLEKEVVAIAQTRFERLIDNLEL